jgi:hypothetical protein
MLFASYKIRGPHIRLIANRHSEFRLVNLIYELISSYVAIFSDTYVEDENAHNVKYTVQ